MDTRPQPGHVDYIQILFAEFTNQQGSPQGSINARADPFLHPRVGRNFLQRLPAWGELQKHADSAKSKQVHHAEVAEGELEGFCVRVQRIELSVVVNDRVGPRKHHLVAPTEFVDQAQDVLIALKPVMIEPFQSPVPMRRLEPGGQPTDLRRGLVDSDLDARLDQVECCGQAGHPCAKQTVIQFKGTDAELLKMYKSAQKEIQTYLKKQDRKAEADAQAKTSREG